MGDKTTNPKAKRGEASGEVPGGSVPKKAKTQVHPAKEEEEEDPDLELRRLVEEAKLQVGVIHGYKDQLPTEQQQRFEDDTIAVEGLLNEISSEL